MSLVLGTALGALLLWIAVRDVHWADLTGRLRSARPDHMAVLGLTYALFIFLRAVRWRMLLSPLGTTPRRPILLATILGYAGNMLLPASMGEVVRVVTLQRRVDLNAGAVVSSVAFERLLDLGVLLALLLVYALALPGLMGMEMRTVALFGGAAAGVLAVAALIVAGVGRERATARAGHGALRRRLTGYLHGAGAQLRAAARPALLARLIVLSLVMWGVMMVCIFAAVRSVGLDAPFVAAGLTVVCIALAMTLPSAPGYVGAIQLAFVLALQPFGTEAAGAVAASIVYQCVGYGVTAALAIWALLDLRYGDRKTPSPC